MSWRQYNISHSGLRLAVQDSGEPPSLPIVALHGWQDNSSSFYPLAEQLNHLRFIAPDFPGHGRSDWRSEQAGYYVWQYLQDVRAVCQSQSNTSGHTLLGHSMGGAIACLYAGVFPEDVKRLVLLDVAGPLATAAEDAPAQMASAIQQLSSEKLARRRYYPDFLTAVQARCKKGLSLSAAKLLAERGVSQDEHGYYWNLDPRLSMKNLMSLSEAHSEAFMRRIRCPVLLISAPGFWQGRLDWFRQRQSYIANLESHELDGGHHQHMESQVGRIAELIREFVGSGD